MNFSANAITQFISIVLGTFASEDLTGVTVGLLIRETKIDPWLGVTACFAGIYLGDLGLWLLGRIGGQRLLALPWIQRRLSNDQFARYRLWLDKHGWIAILTSRFLPASRVPLYVSAGVVGQKLWQFVFWTFVATAVWTPILVIGTALLGQAFVNRFQNGSAGLWVPYAVVGIGALGIVGTRQALSWNRWWIWARISRVWRWEFWPSWLFYLPLVPYLAWLAIRYRSLTVWTASNPAIPMGGVVGESKAAILAQLPQDRIIPTALIADSSDPGPEHRLAELDRQMRQHHWSWPVILKPDASQRGAGVRLIRGEDQAKVYFSNTPGPVIAQPYHPGPFEAGVFYYRIPGEKRGQIYSITDKAFPEVVGDGQSTLGELIWRHPRYRMQADTFLNRHSLHGSRILDAGERFRLAIAGNHCQGTMFRDGGHLITPELESAIDGLAQQFEGFYIGRFDIRYSDLDAFCAGRDFAIVELNGATSESTNIYDPARSLWSAYRILFRQWSLLFQIGNANRQRGIQVVGVYELARLVRDYFRTTRIPPSAD